MNITAVIQARLTSERFPRKILADLHGKPLIAHVVERARQIRGITDVVVAVPDAATKRELDALHLGVLVVAPQYGVSEHDVLGRFVALARRYESVEAFVRLTGDCPHLDPKVAEAVIGRFLQGDCDYCVVGSDDPDVEVFSRDALLKADVGADSDHQREHVCPWMMENLRVQVVAPPKGAKGGKTSIDTRDDLERARG